MAKEPDSWINTPAFQWTPEVPLAREPAFHDALPAAPKIPEPRLETPALPEPEPARMENPAPSIRSMPEPQIHPAGQSRVTPDKAQTQSVDSQFPRRMVVGLGQGVALTALFAIRDGLDPYRFSAALMVLLFAPLLVLAGLGRMRGARLLSWTVFASALLAAAGAYHHWRTQSSDGGHPGLALLSLSGLFLFIGQSIVQAAYGDYSAHCRSAWRLALRIALCALFAGFVWAAADTVSGLLREHFPHFRMPTIALVTLSAALASQLTRDDLLDALQEPLLFAFALALPALLLPGMLVVVLGQSGLWRPPLVISATLAFLLIVGINASYRDGTSWRPFWRRRVEFAASLLLGPLLLMAALALSARIREYGWTDPRIFAAAGLLLMGGYALFYAGSALISLGGGSWMQRIEASNLALAFAALTLIAALASPVADPARLAVASQIYRLQQQQATSDTFDFTWLRDSGLRFGHQALTDMAAMKDAPQVAHGAFLALAAPPQAARPAPTRIGANIRAHFPAGLPAALLARDWSGVDGAPPCLTKVALSCDAFSADLDGGGQNEILLAYGGDTHWWASVMKQGIGGGWYVAGTLAAPPCPGGLTALRAGHFTISPRDENWRDLLVDGQRLSISRPHPPAACPPA